MYNAKYAVMGNPIQHSKSPFIHSQFALQTKQQLTYVAILVTNTEQAFKQAVREFQADGGLGLNITVPFKMLAAEIATQLSSRVQIAGAANTLYFVGDEIQADNTDGIGLVRDLTINNNYILTNKNILILGAGGAARGVLGPLLAQQPASCTIVNRTLSKAQDLANLFAPQVKAISYAELVDNYDLIINATAASLQQELPPLPIMDLTATYCYDMMYAAQDTPFISWCRQHSALQCSDGLGMLVEQAAESFAIWRGIRPNTSPVIQELRTKL
jgi:shikimate dehydrogenase